MYRYHVVERRADQNRLALRCHMGRYHVARALNVMPSEAVALNGDKPHLGFGILLCAASGTVFRVIFESINHAQLSWAPGWAGASGGDD